jgi:hypothetical protein
MATEYCPECGRRLRKPGNLFITLGVMTAAFAVGLAAIATINGVGYIHCLRLNRKAQIVNALRSAHRSLLVFVPGIAQEVPKDSPLAGVASPNTPSDVSESGHKLVEVPQEEAPSEIVGAARKMIAEHNQVVSGVLDSLEKNSPDLASKLQLNCTYGDVHAAIKTCDPRFLKLSENEQTEVITQILSSLSCDMEFSLLAGAASALLALTLGVIVAVVVKRYY